MAPLNTPPSEESVPLNGEVSVEPLNVLMVEGLSALLGKGKAMKAKTTGAVVALLFAGWMAGTARADFTLTSSQQLTVNTYHEYGWLYGQSKITVVSDGRVEHVYAYDSSTVKVSYGGEVSVGLTAFNNSIVDVSGGSVFGSLGATDNSTVDISDGEVNYLTALSTSTVDISGGLVYGMFTATDNSTVNISKGTVRTVLNPHGTSTVNISGGQVYYIETGGSSSVNISGGSLGVAGLLGGNTLYAGGSSTVTFDGKDFILGTGLSRDGNKVLGTGILSGKWMDGTAWTVKILAPASGATILAIPEPATLSLLALGGLAVMRRRRK